MVLCHHRKRSRRLADETGTYCYGAFSFITAAIAMRYYTLWLPIAFFKRRRCAEALHYLAAGVCVTGG